MKRICTGLPQCTSQTADSRRQKKSILCFFCLLFFFSLSLCIIVDHIDKVNIPTNRIDLQIIWYIYNNRKLRLKRFKENWIRLDLRIEIFINHWDSLQCWQRQATTFRSRHHHHHHLGSRSRSWVSFLVLSYSTSLYHKHCKRER